MRKDGKKRSRVDKLFSSTNPCVLRIVLLLLLLMLLMDQYLIKWTNQISLFSCSSGKEKIDHRSFIPPEKRNIVGGKARVSVLFSRPLFFGPPIRTSAAGLTGTARVCWRVLMAGRPLTKLVPCLTPILQPSPKLWSYSLPPPCFHHPRDPFLHISWIIDALNSSKFQWGDTIKINATLR